MPFYQLEVMEGLKPADVDHRAGSLPEGVVSYAFLHTVNGFTPEEVQKFVLFYDIEAEDLDKTINGLQQALGLKDEVIIPFIVEDERAETFIQHQREVKKPNTAARK